MFLQGAFVVAIVVFQVATSLPLKDEKIEPVDLNYNCIQTQGKEKGLKSPILLIHGLAGSIGNWDGVQQVLALSTGRRVCAVDLRNHGDSPWSNKSDLPTMTADIAHFLDKEKIEKVNLIGHSLGGKIAVHYTLNNPERIDSVVVEDMRPNGIPDSALGLVKTALKLLLEVIETVPEGSSEDEARKIIVDFFNKKLKELGITETVDETTAKNFQIQCTDGKCRYKTNFGILEKLLNDPLPESKGLFEGPTLFIYGKRSIFDVGDDKRNIRKLFPNAKLVGVREAGHSIHGRFREFEDEVIKLLNNI